MAELQPRLIKGLQADHIPVRWSGKNASGMRVWGKNVLIQVDPCSPTSKGGVALPDNMVENLTDGATTGCIYAIGPEAFRLFDDGTRWSGDAPGVGDRVFFERYAGILQMGHDGVKYRIMDYRAIGGGEDVEYLAEIAALAAE